LHFGVHGGSLSLPAGVAGTCLSSYACQFYITSISPQFIFVLQARSCLVLAAINFVSAITIEE